MQGLRYLYTNVHSSITHKNQKVETIQILIKRWMNKRNVVCTHDGIYYPILKGKEILIQTTIRMNLEKHTKWNMPNTQKGQMLFDSTYIKYLEQAN